MVSLQNEILELMYKLKRSEYRGEQVKRKEEKKVFFSYFMLMHVDKILLFYH